MSWEQGAAIAGVIGGALVLIQIGDRLWRSKGNGSGSKPLTVAQTPECHYEHCAISDSQKRLEEAMATLSTAIVGLMESNRTNGELLRDIHRGMK
jgi:hypothetical protein